MYLFYAPDIESTSTLPEEESLHCVQVLRAQAGQAVMVTDGKGKLFHCEVVNPHRKHCQLRILASELPPALHQGHVHIAIAPTKNIERLEWMIEKSTEMGIDEITPILCEHSERKAINNVRLQKIMVAAAKQSLKTTFPKLNPLTTFRDCIASAKADDLFIAHCMNDSQSADSSLQSNYAPSNNKSSLKDNIHSGHSVLVLIGPEGDFSDSEIHEALQAHFLPVSLGKARLRTETAGVIACHTALLFNE